MLDRFTTQQRSSTAEVDDLFYEALSWTVSDAFVACDQSTLGLLSSKSISTTHDSSICPYNYWSERDRYVGDPCCSRVAAESECCAAAKRDYVYSKYVVNEDAVRKRCTNAPCLVPAAKELANLLSNEADPNKRDTCRDTRQKVNHSIIVIPGIAHSACRRCKIHASTRNLLHSSARIAFITTSDALPMIPPNALRVRFALWSNLYSFDG